MTNIKLIIQKNGIEFLYGKQLIDKSSSIKETLSDEREIGQIAHKSGFYSLFVSKSYKVYSFINSNVYDQANRESVLSYRLYVDGDKKILNIKKIFEQISLKFENYIKEGNVSNQNYDDILNSIKTVDHNKDSIVGNVLQNSYYLYFSENENLDDIISEEENKLVKKIYFFDKEKAQGESVAREFGLKPITEITKSIKKVKVENHDYYLEHILVNDKPLNYKNLPEFTILCTQNDAITYKNKNSKKAQSFTGNLLQVLKPQPTYPHKSSNENNSKTPVLNYVMIGLLGLLLGGIGGYFGGEFFKKEEKAEAVTEAVTYPEAVSTTYVFKLDKDSKGYTLVPDNITELSNYKFKYNSDGKWLYNENGGEYKELDKIKLKELIKNPSSDSLIINSLESISNQTIPNQLKPEIVAPTNPITTTPTTPEVPKAKVVEKKVEQPKPEKKVEKSTTVPRTQPKKENTQKPEKNKTEGKNNGNGFNSKVY